MLLFFINAVGLSVTYTNLESLIYSYLWLAIHFHNPYCCKPVAAECGGRPLEPVSSNPPVRPRTPQKEGKNCTQTSRPANHCDKHQNDKCAFWNQPFFPSPAGKAAAVRCQSWWWATREICSGSASCLAGRCRSWWRRPGSAVTWSARPSSTGTWYCSSKSCWASPCHGACARTTPPSVCRGRYRGTAAPSCDPENSLHPSHLRSGAAVEEKKDFLSKWLEKYPVASCFTELIFHNEVY